MAQKQTTLFPPPLRDQATDGFSKLSQSYQKWLLTLQNLLPLVEVDTSAGNVVIALPAAGLNSSTGQSNQNQEIIYVKTTADVNTVTVTGAADGAHVATTQYGTLRFKSNGTVWYKV